jgi:NAD-dependent dihydropyrimidine dehydrogenase PreA subunit
MCEFCTKHGEGKKWYLQMKNYSRELVNAQLSPAQQAAAGVATRGQWLGGFMSGFVRADNVDAASSPRPSGSSAGASAAPRTESEIVELRKIVHFGQVIPMTDVEAVLDQVTSITRVPCGCRYISTGKADKRYCFGLGYDPTGIMGKYPDSSSGLEVLSSKEAKRIIREYDKEGLIHSIWTGVTPYVIGLCNCDHDCLAYRGYIEQGGPASFFRAEYVAEVDPELCTGCKSCMKQCQFGAQFYSSLLKRVYIGPQRCFGCGVCMARCKHDAIKLLPRNEHPKVSNLWLKQPEAGSQAPR